MPHAGHASADSRAGPAMRSRTGRGHRSRTGRPSRSRAASDATSSGDTGQPAELRGVKPACRRITSSSAKEGVRPRRARGAAAATGHAPPRARELADLGGDPRVGARRATVGVRRQPVTTGADEPLLPLADRRLGHAMAPSRLGGAYRATQRAQHHARVKSTELLRRPAHPETSDPQPTAVSRTLVRGRWTPKVDVASQAGGHR